MRLSEQCYLDGCDKPHRFTASHIINGATRIDFCCLNHQHVYIAMTTRRARDGTKTAPFLESGNATVPQRL